MSLGDQKALDPCTSKNLTTSLFMEDCIDVMERQAGLGFYFLFLPRGPRDDRNLPGLSLGRIGLLSGSSLHTLVGKTTGSCGSQERTHTGEGYGQECSRTSCACKQVHPCKGCSWAEAFPQPGPGSGSQAQRGLGCVEKAFSPELCPSDCRCRDSPEG